MSAQEERRAHGSVKHCQARIKDGGIVCRYVNSNGRFREIGEPFAGDVDMVLDWRQIERDAT